MKRSRIKFYIDENSYIQFEMYCSLADVFKSDFYTVTLCYQNKVYTFIDDHNPSYPLPEFAEKVAMAAEGNLELCPKISYDLGLLNHWYLGGRHLERLCLQDSVLYPPPAKSWTDGKYSLWECPAYHMDVWLYTRAGQAFLELTPVWPWFRADMGDEEINREASYQAFVDNYRPILTLPIPLKIIEEWHVRMVAIMKILAVAPERQSSWTAQEKFRRSRRRAFRRLQRKAAR